MLRAARVVAGLAPALAVLAASPSGPAAKPVVAKNLKVNVVTNAGGNRLDVLVQVATGRPDRRCDGVAVLGGHRSRLRTLVTGAKGGRQWHWYLGDGAQRGRLVVHVTCRFPDGRIVMAITGRPVGPGPHPRRAFKHVIQPGSLRVEAWNPRGSGSGGSGGDGDLYPKGQCTWYVARQRPDLPYFPAHDGDAKNWIASAERFKLPIGREPRVGAVAVFQPGQYGAGIYGHVAYVTKVDGDRMTIREANYGKRPAGSTRTTGWAGVRFIYRDTLPRAVAPGLTAATPPVVALPKAAPVWPAIDLASASSTRVVGARTVARAGDVNGDGYDDVLVADYAFNNSTGAVWVVFGGPALGDNLNPLTPGFRGFSIYGGAAGDTAGLAVSAVDDVNGDGKDDIAIGAPWSDSSNGNASGNVYVIFGKADTGAISLGALGDQGYRIVGRVGSELAGWSVAGAGDVNGDGHPDVVLGAPNFNFSSGFGSQGEAFVVFGKATATTVDLAAPGSDGFRIDGEASEDVGRSVAGIGDLNGDKLSEVAIGAPGGSGSSSAGQVYVVIGSRTEPVTGRVKIPIKGAVAGERFGQHVTRLGDVDGDGRPDFAVGAPGASYHGRSGSGSVYVVFGKQRLGPSASVSSALGGSGWTVPTLTPASRTSRVRETSTETASVTS